MRVSERKKTSQGWPHRGLQGQESQLGKKGVSIAQGDLAVNEDKGPYGRNA